MPVEISTLALTPSADNDNDIDRVTIAKPAICLQERPRDFVVRNLELRARSPHMVIGYTQR